MKWNLICLKSIGFDEMEVDLPEIDWMEVDGDEMPVDGP
jgi:hypothetical protein